jgi:hypothetical protein
MNGGKVSFPSILNVYDRNVRTRRVAIGAWLGLLKVRRPNELEPNESRDLGIEGDFLRLGASLGEFDVDPKFQAPTSSISDARLSNWPISASQLLFGKVARNASVLW